MQEAREMDGKNPLIGIDKRDELVADPDLLPTPLRFSQPGRNTRNLKKFIRAESAREAIEPLSEEIDLFGFTKGQFSMIDLISAVLEKTGPAHILCSTWTAAKQDLESVVYFLESDRLLSARFILDFSFQKREPQTAYQIRRVFGDKAIRLTRMHAKFFQVHTDDGRWHLTANTSMNLNYNPRFEYFDLTNNLDKFNFLKGIADILFARRQTTRTEDLSWKFMETEFASGLSE